MDGHALEQLCGGLGYARTTAAEALKQADNDLLAAIDMLSDPGQSGA